MGNALPWQDSTGVCQDFPPAVLTGHSGKLHGFVISQ